MNKKVTGAEVSTDRSEIGFQKIPKEWSAETVKQIANDEEDDAFTDGDWIESNDMDDDGSIQLVQLGHIGEGKFRAQPDKFITREFADDEKCTLLDTGDLLISRMQEPILRACLLPEFPKDSIMAVDIARLKPKKDWNKFFLMFLLNSRPVWKQGLAWASGTTRKRISRSNLAKIELQKPPLPEQRKIASVLYNVDRAIQKTEEIIEQTRRVKKGVMQDLFTEGYFDHRSFIQGSWRNRSKKIPEKWGVFQAKKILDVSRGAHPRPKSDSTLWGGEIPIIKIGDRNRGKKGIITHTEDSVTQKGSQKSKLVPEGTVIVSNAGTCGEARIVGMEACIHDHWLILKDHEEGLDKRFLYYYINWNKRFLQGVASGSTVTDLNTDDFRLFDILVPSIEEQIKIADVLDSIQEKIDVAKSQMENLRRVKQGLMQDLLTGKVRTHDKDIEVLDDIKEQ